MEPSALHFLQLHRHYRIDTDVFPFALEAVLRKHQNKYNPNMWATIGYLSQAFNQVEQKQSTTKWECRVVIWAIQSLRSYIVETSSNVLVDQKALKCMLTYIHPNRRRLMRWRLRIRKLYYKVLYWLTLVYQRPNNLSRILHPSDTKVSDILMLKFLRLNPTLLLWSSA